MSQDSITQPPERVVHATSAAGQQLVRYDRSGKWYVEDGTAIAQRRHVTINEAVQVAIDWWSSGGTPHLDRPGGAMFNAKIRRLYRTVQA